MDIFTDVEEADVAVSVCALDKTSKVLGQDVLVEMSLESTHFNAEDPLTLGGE